jgi:hypothetical protein
MVADMSTCPLKKLSQKAIFMFPFLPSNISSTLMTRWILCLHVYVGYSKMELLVAVIMVMVTIMVS